MSGEGPILRIRSFRAMWQLYLEVLFLPLVIPMILGMALWLFTRHYDRDTQFILTIAPYILGIAGGIYLRFFHNGLTRKWIEVHRHGLVVGAEYIPWRAVRDIDYTTATEATVLGSYNIPWRYEDVATVSVLTVDGRERRFRLKMDGLKAFARAVREALGEGAPESMRGE
jgi:hypothetical protein